MLNTRKQELLRLYRPLKSFVLSFAQTIEAPQKLVQELPPEIQRFSPHRLGAEVRERLVLVDHVFLALDTEIRDCVGGAECPVDEILRVNRNSSKLEEAARSEEDRGRRPGASYFVVSENEDNEPVSSLGTAFTRPNSTAFSGASSLSTPTSSSVTFLGTFASRSSRPYSQKGIPRSFLFTAPPEKSNSLASIYLGKWQSKDGSGKALVGRLISFARRSWLTE
jgi:hypothetical protein